MPGVFHGCQTAVPGERDDRQQPNAPRPHRHRDKVLRESVSRRPERRRRQPQVVDGRLRAVAETAENYIDLYWMHCWDHHTPIDETMRGLDDLVRAGKVRYIGFSDTPAWKVVEAQMLARF